MMINNKTIEPIVFLIYGKPGSFYIILTPNNNTPTPKKAHLIAAGRKASKIQYE